MNDIQQLIEQAKALLVCPSCGRHFAATEIKFKGFMDHTCILQASCSNQHPALFTTWITSYSPTRIEDVTPLDSDHILSLHQALERFDGNCTALWSKKR